MAWFFSAGIILPLPLNTAIGQGMVKRGILLTDHIRFSLIRTASSFLEIIVSWNRVDAILKVQHAALSSWSGETPLP
jgi:hypothetical protein